MHHKFEIFDRSRFLTGVTTGLARCQKNLENSIVSPIPLLLPRFIEKFEELWRRFA